MVHRYSFSTLLVARLQMFPLFLVFLVRWCIEYSHGLRYGFDGPLALVYFYNLHYLCSTNIRSRDKARRIYVSCSVHFIFVVYEKKKSIAGFTETRYVKLRNNFPSTAVVNRLVLLFDLHLHRASRQSSARYGETIWGSGKASGRVTLLSALPLDSTITRPLLDCLLDQIVYTGRVKHAFSYSPLYRWLD
jgi:hypothetical protein